MSADDERVLEEAWQALEAGEPEAALEGLARVAPDCEERFVPEALAWLDCGDSTRAAAALDEARARFGADDAGVLWVAGELALRRWEVDEAYAAFDRLAQADGEEVDPATLERLALCADLTERYAEADHWLERARQLDPERPAPPRLEEAEFEELVGRAVDALPFPFQAVLERVPVLIDSMPGPELFPDGDLEDYPPDILGLYVGPDPSQESMESGEHPPVIHLFQRNLERAVATLEELEEEVQVTLYHELGHALGFDEDGVESMGLE